MKIVSPSVVLAHATPDPERVIERMGRVCYQSQHRVTECYACGGTQVDATGFDQCASCEGTGTSKASAIAFVRMVRERGHESVLEHVSAGFLIVTDRGVTHELVRHRIASFSQESTRYCNYGQDRFGSEISVVEPPGLREPGYTGAPGLSDGDLCAWHSVMEGAEHIYLEMLGRGVSPQIARSVLPNSLKSEIGMTANAREWRHFLKLRTAKAAHPQMREVARMIGNLLREWSPVLFEDIETEGP